MTIRNLDYLFKPKSVAVIGASDRPHSVGSTVLRNLRGGAFSGPVYAVNSRHTSVAGECAYADVDALPAVPDLAVICTPPQTIPGLIGQLGARGTRAAVVLTAGLNRERAPAGGTLTAAMLAAARPHLLRILGPNCVGLMVPELGLNASFAHTSAAVGKIALVSQSGALTTALLDWANARGIGFSHLISLGDSADVDFGDVIDYLANDAGTRAILLYIEAIGAARKFMSAGRAAARNKPVIVVKAGRVPAAAKAAASHTGALAGADEVYDAALRRAGMLRVDSTQALFDAAETLTRARPLFGDRLAIITNGGGPGVMAIDALVMHGGRPAELSAATLDALDAVLPANWSRGNPIDIIGDAPAARYVEALRIVLQDGDTDAVLLIHAPTAIVPSAEIATACLATLSTARRTVLACWLGGDAVKLADTCFREAGVPTYGTPEAAVQAFMQLVDFRRNQEALLETPAANADFEPQRAVAMAVIDAALQQGRPQLDEAEAKQVLAAYGIPVVATRSAATAAAAVQQATELGYPVALKIVSPDINHKSDVGGVALNLPDAAAVSAAAADMLARCARDLPAARLAGFTVQTMIRRGAAHELIAGMATDPSFGPVLMFGQGGTSVEVVADRVMSLPPLNIALARDAVGRTRIARLLAGYRDRPAIDFDALYQALVRLSQLVIDLPALSELDINPLLADAQGVIALDARMRVAAACGDPELRLAIRPYPAELARRLQFDGRSITLRPIRPDDEPGLRQLLAACTQDDLYYRYFHAIRALPHSELARNTQIDYDREMAFVAVADDAQHTLLGEVRALGDPDNVRAEFAVLIRSDEHRKGLGRVLLETLIDYCRARGTHELVGDVLATNYSMLKLAHAVGFETVAHSDSGTLRIRLTLRNADA